MGYSNLSTQAKIKRGPGYVAPLILNVRTEYFTACPNPITFDIEVVSGDVREHYYEWSIMVGPVGKFKPNIRTLMAVFDPLGSKEKRVIQLTVDKNTPEEQVFTLNLYDKATSFNETVQHNTSARFPFTNELSRAVKVLDLNFSVNNLPLYPESEKILNFGSFGELQFVNDEIWKVEILEWYSLDPVATVYYPHGTVLGIDTTKRYLAKTWYKYGKLPELYAWSELSLINVSATNNLTALLVRDDVEPVLYNSESHITTYLGNGGSTITVSDNPELFLFNSISKRTLLGMKWIDTWEEPEDPPPPSVNLKTNEKSGANNSPRLQRTSSGSSLVTLLNFKSGIVG